MKQQLSIINTLILLIVLRVTSQNLDRWIGKLAIVTGASSGIGETTARTLVGEGINVLGLARREEYLRNIQNNLTGSRGSFHYLKCDVRNETDIVNAFKYADENFGGVDILINNAGVARNATFAAIKVEDLHEVTDTNLIAPVICIREALKSLRRHKREGHIINMNSITGINANILDPLPFNMYPVTKFGLRALADEVRSEIARAKDIIRMTSIYPDFVKTGLFDKTRVNEQIAHIIQSKALLTKDIANSILYVLSAPPHVQIEHLVITRLVGSE